MEATTLETIKLFVLPLILLIVLSAICYAIYWKKFKHLIQMTQGIPTPPSLPFLGHAHLLMFTPPHELVPMVKQLMAKYMIGEKCLKLWLGPELNLLLFDLQDIRTILSGFEHLDKACEYKTLEPWLNEGLLISNSRKWRKRRKIIMPAVHFNILREFVDVFEKNSRIFLSNLDKEYQKQSPNGFDIYEWITYCTLDAICDTAMGVSVHAQTNTDSDYINAVNMIAAVLHKRMFNVFYRLEFTYRFTKLAREEAKALAVLHGFTDRIILQRREELLKAQQAALLMDPKHIEAEENKQKLTFLDILLQSQIDGQPLSNLDIREEVDTFMLGGHDTISSAILFCFYNLAVNPECQQKCFAEIIEVLGKDKAQPVTYDDLNGLQYVELCIKETLRMFPTLPLFGRKLSKDCELSGKTIPAGTNIGICPLILGRFEELFPDPNSFRPERFDIQNNSEKHDPYAYLPFSAGPRNCVGQKFAMFELKTIVANVLRHYEIEYVGKANEEPALIAELVLRPKDTLMFKIKPRIY